MHDDTARADPSLDEQIVAYLDGELAPEDRRRMEERLAGDPAARRRLQEMERTWDLLDDLDAAPAGDRFAQTTLEMVATAAGEDLQRSRPQAPRRRRLLALGAAIFASAAAGFLAVWLLAPDANARIIGNLPLLENLDAYRQIGDMAMLRLLAERGLFVPEQELSVAAVSEETPERRRQRILAMSPEQKEQLARAQERFDALDVDQQTRIRRLHDDLQSSEQGPRLRQVMQAYFEWLKTQNSYTRAELSELAPIERVAAVEKLLETDRSRFGVGRRLSPRDAEAIWKWMDQCATRHEAQLLALLPEPRRGELAQWSSSARHRMVLLDMGRRWQMSDDGRPPALDGADLARLRAAIGPELRAELEALPEARQWQTLSGWMRQLARQRMVRGPLTRDDDQRLLRFFEQELSDQQRDRLLSMPGDEMQRELQRMYMMRGAPHGPAPRRPRNSDRERETP